MVDAFANGGVLQPALRTVRNDTDEPEPVLPHTDTDRRG